MGFVSCCRDCSCWCVFVFAMSILLVVLGLAINDLAAVIELQQAADSVEETPSAELTCFQVCRSWFSEERGTECCDRVVSEQCMEKEACKKEYLSAKEGQMNVLAEAVWSQIIISAMCLSAVLVIGLIQYRRGQYLAKEDIQARIQSVIKKLLREKEEKLFHSRDRQNRSHIKETTEKDIAEKTQFNILLQMENVINPERFAILNEVHEAKSVGFK